MGPLKGIYKLQRHILLLRKEYELHFNVDYITAKIQLLFHVRALKLDIIDIEITEIGDISLDVIENNRFLTLPIEEMGEIVVNHDGVKEELIRVLSPHIEIIIQQEVHKVFPKMKRLIMWPFYWLRENILALLCLIFICIVIDVIFTIISDVLELLTAD